MTLFAYLAAACLLLLTAWVVFRMLVRRSYRERGRLTPLVGFLELLVWLLYVAFPTLYNPIDWWLVWFADPPVGPVLTLIGSALVIVGMGSAVAAMLSLGMGVVMGQQSGGLKQTGWYGLSRNPQIVGLGLAVTGVALLWPSWYALGWVVLGAAIAHMMVLTEEEHLRRTLGESYQAYCQRTPRYVGLPRGEAEGANA
jgi:protein-S-isoprenylcysteine O-methyltransferase Ste14